MAALLSTASRKAQPAAVEATVALAGTPAEREAARLWGSWAAWSRRFNAAPTAANDDREGRAWRRLVAHVEAAGLTDTAFDPRD